MAVAVYAFVVIKDKSNEPEVRKGYTQIFDGYNTAVENKNVVDGIQSVVGIFVLN